MMKYAVIGTGAIGGYYGGKLAHAGAEVHFLLHSDYDYVCQHGLQVDSCHGSFHLARPLIHRSTLTMPQVDVVIVALKSTNERLLSTLLPPLLHPHTLVLLIQNGIGLEAEVQTMFPGLHLAAGLAFICSAKSEPGRVNHQCYGHISIANYSCPSSHRIALLVDELCAAGVQAQAVDYLEARWKKQVWNMPFNGMTVVMNAQTDELLSVPPMRRLIHAMMLEVIGAAQALGAKHIHPSFADEMIESTLVMTPYSPSMKLDYEHRRPMEIEFIYTRAIRQAHEAGFDMPCLRMLEAQLHFLVQGMN